MKFGCKYGLPHDMQVIHENKRAKWEICRICNKKFRFNKGYRSRIDNQEYLKIHARNFCQKFGATKRLYMKIYQPEKTIIHI